MHAAGSTPHGRRRKDPYQDTQEEYESLLQEFQRLEAEQRALRCTEHSLLHVLDSLDVVCKAANLQASGQQKQDLNGQLTAAIVQQQEEEIAALLAGVGLHSNITTTTSSDSSSSDSSSSQVNRAALEHAAQASSMTAEQLTQRLAELAAKLALHVIAHEAQHGPDAHTAQPCADLVNDVDEYGALLVQAILWDGAKYQAILNTNLKTQQPFSEPLPAHWWLAVMQRVQLTDAQSEAVMALYAYAHHRMEPVRNELAQVLRQQAADTQQLEQALQQHKRLEQPATGGAASAGSASERTAAAADRDAGLGAAAAAGGRALTAAEAAAAAAVAAEPGAQQLLQRQNNLLRRLRLHSLHVGIAVYTQILSQFQVAVLISASFPSIPYVASAIAAWGEHYQQLKQQQQQQQQQRRRRRQQSQQGGAVPHE